MVVHRPIGKFRSGRVDCRSLRRRKILDETNIPRVGQELFIWSGRDAREAAAQLGIGGLSSRGALAKLTTPDKECEGARRQASS